MKTLLSVFDYPPLNKIKSLLLFCTPLTNQFSLSLYFPILAYFFRFKIAAFRRSGADRPIVQTGLSPVNRY